MKISKKLQDKIDWLAEICGDADISISEVLEEIVLDGGKESVTKMYEEYKAALEEE